MRKTGENLAGLEADMDEAPATQQPDGLRRLTELGFRVLRLDAEIAELEVAAAEKRAAKLAIVTKDMVELMEERGVESIAVEGREFVVKDHFHASIKEDNREDAHDWLEEHEAGDLIKYEVVATFPKDCQEEADKLVLYVTKRYQMAKVISRRGVPWARLTSWVRDMVLKHRREPDRYEALPMELLGAHVARVVSYSDSKKKRLSKVG